MSALVLVIGLVVFFGAGLVFALGICASAKRGDEQYARAIRDMKTRASR